MTIAQPTARVRRDRSRNDVILCARALLDELAARAIADGIDYAQDIAEAWEARLRSASEVAPGYLLPSDTITALDDLMDFVRATGPQDALAWLDLLPRNVLELAEPDPVALQPEFTISARGLDNIKPGAGWAGAWEPVPGHALPATLGAAA